MKTRFKFNKTDHVIVLTGAGISAESGLKTFRDHDGLWENHKVENVCTLRAFESNPQLVWDFYKQRYKKLDEVKPNPGHFALQKLEKFLGENFMLITQNIDGLHQAAGNKRVIEMHGSLNSSFCTECSKDFAMQEIYMKHDIPVCTNCGGKLRPDIVWFGEIPYFMNEIDAILRSANYFLVAGTSGTVQPAASLVYLAKANGAKTIGVNLQPPQNLMFIDEFHMGKSGEMLPELVDLWIN
ncbi:MAG: NAD-dependent deacylase [Candidatus Cloacimonetes bacterium]|nr:NAD-dependent deacylase [Candidatus Cloacimonadota bacterium]MCF7813313.1 NAD-dependent deacylase [Candidatus Cloacimonadota bacterium]MCF7867388.1 NAD-dependent deacylase [Candidatus Cloacimonadota bacterium]MCF7882822.1 NAD-dependent deacylase [Candidatus Cloacimonadota bacterium]